MLEYIVLGIVLGGFGCFIYEKIKAKRKASGGTSYPTDPKYPPHDPK